MINNDLANRKLFSLNDLLAMGLIRKEDIENFIRRREAEKLVKELFPGMF